MVVTVVDLDGHSVRLGIEAPPHVLVARAELPAETKEGLAERAARAGKAVRRA